MATVTQIKRKTGAVWRLSWVDPASGKQERRVIGDTSVVSKGDAHAALKTLELELATNKTNSIVGLSGRGQSTTKWEDAVDAYLIWHKRKYPSNARTREILNGPMGTWMAGLTLEGISTNLELTREYFDSREELAPGTMNRELRTLRALFNWAHKEAEIIESHRLHKLSDFEDNLDQNVHFFTEPQMKALLEKSSERRQHWWRLMANTGMRRSEALGLRWDMVNEAGGQITLASTNVRRTKSGKRRHVPLTPGAREALEQLKKETDGAEYVLPQLAPESLSRAFSYDVAAAELEGHLHMLRHTFASHLIMQGKPLFEVSKLLGHASMKTTERHYIHLTPGYLQKTVEGFSL